MTYVFDASFVGALIIPDEKNLSSYDAAYLELAERANAVLCTLDEDLRAVAKKRGVAVLK